MRSCEQTAGQTILEHGFSVAQYLEELLDFLDGKPLDEARWRIPTWIAENRDLLRGLLPSREMLREYAIFHDCGKPRCRTVDAEGRVHFPDHAEVSYRAWLEAGGDEDVAFLIRHDMTLHTATSIEAEAFAEGTEPRFLAALLLSALAEVHSNARMFGGIESTSFKIKWKQIDRRGRRVCAILKR
jgi:hypothetical protein